MMVNACHSLIYAQIYLYSIHLWLLIDCMIRPFKPWCDNTQKCNVISHPTDKLSSDWRNWVNFFSFLYIFKFCVVIRVTQGRDWDWPDCKCLRNKWPLVWGFFPYVNNADVCETQYVLSSGNKESFVPDVWTAGDACFWFYSKVNVFIILRSSQSRLSVMQNTEPAREKVFSKFQILSPSQIL